MYRQQFLILIHLYQRFYLRSFNINRQFSYLSPPFSSFHCSSLLFIIAYAAEVFLLYISRKNRASYLIKNHPIHASIGYLNHLSLSRINMRIGFAIHCYFMKFIRIKINMPQMRHIEPNFRKFNKISPLYYFFSLYK